MMTNTGRQVPNVAKSVSTSHGAIAAPTDDPLSNSATAQPLSRRGNHSETALVAPGQLADSPRPSRKRNAQNDRKPVASDVAMAATEYSKTDRLRPRRVPSRSSIGPETAWPVEYARRNAMMTHAKSAFVHVNSVLRYGARTLSV